MKHIVKMLKENGAKEVHIRIASPMVVNSCFWGGIDIPDKSEIIGANRTKTDIKILLDADSLEFISLEFLLNYLGGKKRQKLLFSLFSSNINFYNGGIKCYTKILELT